MKVIQPIYLVLFIAILTEASYAHPPKDIELSFDAEKVTLSVSVLHKVAKYKKHYIEKIVVALNDEEIITQIFNIQGSKDKQEVCYIIPGVKDGDKFSVTAYCNISGKKTSTLQIEEEPQSEEE